ncbi:hypothetical protein HK097_009108 [Rhizophlyctis rosea]|uniref:Talin N-terminal F0 domain-containing protein n=1 Tax=Rhizophlyctis rosea TaxID=64517 RepID=A0AAD5X1A7_9FUNG|nr:hypothetical protein HK097_009108 [Rhizophlyctis rosea]
MSTPSSAPSTPASAQAQIPTPQPTSLILRVSIPSKGVQKALRASSADRIWDLKKQIIDKMANDIKDALNYGVFWPAGGAASAAVPAAPGTDGRIAGQFLDESKEVGGFKMDMNTLLEFIPKQRIIAATEPPESPNANNKKKQKAFFEAVQKGNIDKVRERALRGQDANFVSESQETPLSAATLLNDPGLITSLITECGAHTDYRVGEAFLTPLHLAAKENKLAALQTLLGLGAWANAPDARGLTPLWYAASGGHTECVMRLLVARAETDVVDEKGWAPLHLACAASNEPICALLIDHGAGLNLTNTVGNTPLHVCATRNAVGCARWLLLRGAEKEKANKGGQTAQQLAVMSGNLDLFDLVKKWVEESVVPPPPKPQYDDTGVATNMPAYHARATAIAAQSQPTTSQPRPLSMMSDTSSSGITRSNSASSLTSVATKRSTIVGTDKLDKDKQLSRRRSKIGRSKSGVVNTGGIPPPPSIPKPEKPKSENAEEKPSSPPPQQININLPAPSTMPPPPQHLLQPDLSEIEPAEEFETTDFSPTRALHDLRESLMGSTTDENIELDFDVLMTTLEQVEGVVEKMMKRIAGLEKENVALRKGRGGGQKGVLVAW